MKTIILFFLITAISYSQKIEKDIDDFTGDTIYTLKSSNLSGGSFFEMKNANLALVYHAGKTLFINMMVTANKIFSVKSAITGKSLFIKTDKQMYELADNGQNSFDAGVSGSGICKVVYVINFDLIKDIIESKEPKVRIVTADEQYLDFYFGEDNIKEYKKFYNKFN